MRTHAPPRRRGRGRTQVARVAVAVVAGTMIAGVAMAIPSRGTPVTSHARGTSPASPTRHAVSTSWSAARAVPATLRRDAHTTARPVANLQARVARTKRSRRGTTTSTTTTTAPPATTTTVAPTTTTTTTTIPPAATACQGTTPLGLTGSWHCTFDDEFNGTALDTSHWLPQVTATSGFLNGATACYVDSPDTISESGGYLDLSVRQVAPFTCSYGSGSFTASYEAGMVTTYGLFDQTYGAFEVNAKLPPATVAGLQETFWLYPQTLTYGPWPASGEIDFAESFSEYPGLDVPYVHYSQSSTDPYVTAYDCTIDQNAFNTYGVDWTPTSITVLYNGHTCLVDHPTTGSEPFDQPFFIALTQALGIGTNAFSASTTPTPATTQVDWVRAWTPSS